MNSHGINAEITQESMLKLKIREDVDPVGPSLKQPNLKLDTESKTEERKTEISLSNNLWTAHGMMEILLAGEEDQRLLTITLKTLTKPFY